MTHWEHFVGGYYTPFRFVEEAQREGVQRRVPAALAATFQYGDTVDLLWWDRGHAHRIGAFVVASVTVDDAVAHEVGQALVAQGQASYQPGGGVVVRGCGSYVIAGTWVVTASLQDIVNQARTAAAEAGAALKILIGGPLVDVTDPPQPVDSPDHFFRGFRRVGERAAVPDPDDPLVIGMRAYQVRHHKERRDIQLALAFAA